MSQDQGPSGPPGAAPSPRLRRHPLLTVLMVIVGLILLLPGLCSLIFLSMSGVGGGEIVALWLICLAISAGGVAMLVRAAK